MHAVRRVLIKLPLVRLQLLIPTRTPFQFPLATYDEWIALIQSCRMSDCHITDYQRETLLKIALAYRAFASVAHPDVCLDDFDILAGCLVSAAKVLGRFDRANATLQEAVDYLELHLPEVSAYICLVPGGCVCASPESCTPHRCVPQVWTVWCAVGRTRTSSGRAHQ